MSETNREKAQQMVDFWGSWLTEVEKLEKAGVENLFGSLDETALLTKASVNYTSQLAASWRKMSFEAARRAIEAMPAFPGFPAAPKG